MHGAYFEIDAGAGLVIDNINTTYGALDFQKDISPFFVNGGTLNIRTGNLTNNSNTPPEFGGVIFNQDGYVNIGDRKTNGDISLHDSRATMYGGVIYNAGGVRCRLEVRRPDMRLHCRTIPHPDGGAIYSNGGTVTIQGTTISGNKADNNGLGGGLFANNTALTVLTSTFTGNMAGRDGSSDAGEGGAIFDASKHPATIRTSTFADNNSGAGGAIFYQGSRNNPLQVTNSTFYDSPFPSIPEMTLYVSSGTAQITFSTSVNGGFQTINSGKIRLRNTIALADSICRGAAASYIDGGHNIQFSTTPNCPETIPNVDPVLDPSGLRNNGGPTQTIAILADSPAINAVGIRNCTTPDGKRVLTDQRLLPRPAPPPNRCDIGAYEVQ